MKVKEIVESELISKLKSKLKAKGFLTSGNTWYLVGPNTYQFLNIQYSTSNIGSEGKFTFNFGVATKSYLLFAYGKEYQPKIKDIRFPVQRRIGELLEGSDRWYQVRSEKNNEIELALFDINETLLPLMFSLTDDGNVLDFLNGKRKITLEENKIFFFLTATLSDKTRALLDLEEYISSLSDRAIGALENMKDFRIRIERI